jgi:hypothetical protein
MSEKIVSEKIPNISRRKFMSQASKSSVAPAALLLFSATTAPTDVAAQYNDPSKTTKKDKDKKKKNKKKKNKKK